MVRYGPKNKNIKFPYPTETATSASNDPFQIAFFRESDFQEEKIRIQIFNQINQIKIKFMDRFFGRSLPINAYN